MKRELGAIAITAGLVFAGGCSKAESVERPLTPVRTQPIELYSSSEELRYAANVQPDRQVNLAFAVGGYVMALARPGGRDIQEGDSVRAGTVLAQLRQSDYTVKITQARAQLAEGRAGVEASKAQVAEAEAALERATRDHTRARNLLDSQSLTRAEYDAAKAQLDAAQARADAARHQVNVVEARSVAAGGVVSEAELALGDTSLRAPMDGVVLKRNVEVGSLAAPGNPAFVLADTRNMKVMFGVPDTVVSSMKVGASLPVRTEGLPDVEFVGRVTRVAPAADTASRVFDVEVTVPNPRDQLKTGMIASVVVRGATATKQVPVAPLSAVVRSRGSGKGYAVFVVQNEGGKQVARLRDVQLGEAFGNRVAVLSGVGPGQRLITEGSQLVNDGETVRVIP